MVVDVASIPHSNFLVRSGRFRTIYTVGWLLVLGIVVPGQSLIEPLRQRLPTTSTTTTSTMNRKQWFQKLARWGEAVTTAALLTNGGTTSIPSANAFSSSSSSGTSSSASTLKTLASYKSVSMPIPEFGVTVPVACWFPYTPDTTTTTTTSTSSVTSSSVTYDHQISVRRIGQLLAKWDFIPTFVSRQFTLKPTLIDEVVQVTSTSTTKEEQELVFPPMTELLSMSTSTSSLPPIIFLAHGYLGSRFDLSHLAEKLATLGFICIAPEYPESLAASYETTNGLLLDRTIITNHILQILQEEWNINNNDATNTAAASAAVKFGIVGHSLGCGTCLETGDDTWTRVLISGIPRDIQRNGKLMPKDNLLYVISKQDGVTSRFSSSGSQLPTGYELISEEQVPSLLLSSSSTTSTKNSSSSSSSSVIPTKAIFQIDRIDGPNHISFLAEGVNNAMVDFLSPLLPIAQVMSIPVLDFDKYQISRDSVVTAQAYQPLVCAYLQQQMMK